MHLNWDRDAARTLAEALADGRIEPSSIAPEAFVSVARELRQQREELALQREELARQHNGIDRARQRYRELFERAPVGYLILDHDGVIEDANDTALSLVGRRRQDLLQHELTWYVTPSSRTVWAQMFADAAEGRRRTCELDVIRGDGAGASLRVEAVTLSRGRDEPRLLLSLSDNAPHIEAARAVRHSELNYQRLFDVNPLPMLIVARDGFRVLAANPAAEQAYGYTGVEFHQRSLAELACDEDVISFMAWLASGGRGRAERPYHLHRRDNTAMVAEVLAHDVVFHTDDAVLVVIEDITERWNAEREARRADELRHALFNASPVGIIYVGQSRDVPMMNAAATRILDLISDDRDGNVFSRCCRVDGLAEMLLKALSHGVESGPSDLRVTAVKTPRVGGSRATLRHLTASVTPIGSAEGRVSGALVALTDITQRKMLEEQLRQSDKLRVIGQLAGGIAHDFNNVLTVILSCATAIDRHLPDDETIAPITEDVHKASRRAAHLTRQLLAFTRRQPSEDCEVAVDAAAREWVGSFLRRLVPEHIALDVQLDSCDACVALNQTQFHQLLVNLVLNARDAMPRGGTITLRTTLDASQDPPRAIIEVEDTGVGMAPEVAECIFEPFFTTKEPDQGTGLGLTTVFGIVHQAEGEISVDSEQGRGTRFRISMPCTQRVSRPTAPPPRLVISAGGESVLLVEDDDIVRRSLSRELRRLGFRVFDADGIENAREVAQMYRDTIRVLLSDVVMPVANGLEVAREVRQIIPGVAVVFMSGYTNETFTPMGLLQEMGAVVAKPFTPEEMAGRLREALARASAAHVSTHSMPTPSPILPLRLPAVNIHN
jgi:PAS domain S-box-containing protein